MSPEVWRRVNMLVTALCFAFVVAVLLSSCGTPYQPPGDDLWLMVR